MVNLSDYLKKLCLPCPSHSFPSHELLNLSLKQQNNLLTLYLTLAEIPNLPLIPHLQGSVPHLTPLGTQLPAQASGILL